MTDLYNDLNQLKAHLERQRELKNPGVQIEKRNPEKLLAAVSLEMGDCQRCNLHTTRTHLVFGKGNPDADLMFVGEAPGADEDIQGEPFVGRAGQLLGKIIAAMGKTRDQVYIANILKCRPPENRNPNPDEIAICSPFLMQQIEAIQPKVICALGTFAAQTMLKTDTTIGRLRGRPHPFNETCALIPTYHPAYLLRSPSKKKEVWEDMQVIMKLLSWPLPAKT
ncbi:MAG: uracil-DNA glycosylase [Deltaproteobacteria bacterium]|nr:MAG: uracil-DNA glycosylase [Deltaproteobacteria bacterium]